MNETYVMVVAIIVILFQGFAYYYTANTFNENMKHVVDTIVEEAKRTIMYDKISLSDDSVVNGYYNYQDRFYCVWMENRTQEDIMITDVHEQCHYWVHLKYDHFCGLNDSR